MERANKGREPANEAIIPVEREKRHADEERSRADQAVAWAERLLV